MKAIKYFKEIDYDFIKEKFGDDFMPLNDDHNINRFIVDNEIELAKISLTHFISDSCYKFENIFKFDFKFEKKFFEKVCEDFLKQVEYDYVSISYILSFIKLRMCDYEYKKNINDLKIIKKILEKELNTFLFKNLNLK